MKSYLTLVIGAIVLNQFSCSKSDNTPADPIPPVVIVLPTVTTNTITAINTTTAKSGGVVTSNGGGAISAQGVCWSISPNPIITDSKTVDGISTNTFTSSMTGLLEGTTYFVRAYATNSAGTAYGSEVNFLTASTPPIGQNSGGGIIFYVDGTGQHGLIAAISDQTSGTTWYNGTFLATLANSNSNGAANTQTIINTQGNGSYAAILCKSYNGGGFNDWFLPSIDQLALLYAKRAVVGGFAQAEYWASTESTSSAFQTAWSMYFGNFNGSNNQGENIKWTNLHVRAIRAY